MQNEVLVQCLGRFSKSNIPMLMFEEMYPVISSIWRLGERTNCISVRADTIALGEIVKYAQGNIYDGILLRFVEKFSVEQQVAFAQILKRLKSFERGKFILTTGSEFERLNSELLAELCKIKFSVQIESIKDDSISHVVR